MSSESPSFANQVLDIESVDLEAQGIAHRADGKVVFVEGALPFEKVIANIHRKKNNWEQGSLKQLVKASSQRVEPGCPNFGLHAGACGGCKMQHIDMYAQVAIKQRVLEDNLLHLGKVVPDKVLRPLQGPDWGYRFRARLSVRYVVKKDKVLIGFHERKSSYVADMDNCAVLPKHVSDMLLPLRELIGRLKIRDQCPQIELACGEDITALVLRHLAPVDSEDAALLAEFAQQYRVQWWLQAKGPDSVVPLLNDTNAFPSLFYDLPEFDLRMYFRPTDFTQVNPAINRNLVVRAMQFLNIQPKDRLIDWFCGLGNFTLPMARVTAHVTGVEGSQPLLDWAAQNQQMNRKRDNESNSQSALHDVDFKCLNLFEMTAAELLTFQPADKWLIDPPREGAFALVKALVELIEQPPTDSAWKPPQRIVYVSCNPATLARDAGLLVNVGNYKCVAAGMVNMFPHTAHVESMAVFELP